MTEIELLNKCSNLEAENEKLNLQLKNFEENVTRIITNFWCWYVSGNHKRDLSAKEEGEKYANNFFHDLIQEEDERRQKNDREIFSLCYSVVYIDIWFLCYYRGITKVGKGQA